MSAHGTGVARPHSVPGAPVSAIGRRLAAIVNLAVTEECDDDARAARRVFTGACLFVVLLAPFWTLTYMGFGEPGAGLIPLTYGVITLASFVALARFDGWQWFRLSQLVMIFVLPFALMVSLGGYIPGSAVMLWAILAPIGALWAGRSREALGWALAFVIGAVACGFANPYLRDSNNLPNAAITFFFVMNITSVAAVILLLLDFFVRQKDSMIEVMRRNRELESAYLAQEITLRQSEKLATLGKLSAGMAHELNNPTAAAQQATEQLNAMLIAQERTNVERADVDLNDAETAALHRLSAAVTARVRQPEFLDPLECSDRETAVQEYLEAAGIDRAWEHAPNLVSLGLDVSGLAALAEEFRPDRYATVLSTLDHQYMSESLLRSLGESTDRIVQIVGALKSYTRRDEAPTQLVDLHEGLDSTLVMLQSRLKIGIEVDRDFAGDLPLIEARGSELNQVWTNILDNAIDAMDGHGIIGITTRTEGTNVVVEITDNGPGIPDEIVAQIFDPFVTTKAPGEGTGLGLNISHSIITQQHGGTITVASAPGRTTFTITLPVFTRTDDDSARERQGSPALGVPTKE